MEERIEKDTGLKTIFRYDRTKIYLLLAIFICFILMYILNKLYPLFGEDWDYAYFWVPDSNHPDRVQSLWDIVRSQYNHYMHWGGRSVAHGLDQFLLMIGQGWHDLLNTLAFVAFCYTIYKIANYENKTNVFVFILTFFALWFIQPVFIVDTLWLTYSANYLWMTMIILAFVYPYYLWYRGTERKDNVIQIILFFLFGIVAGWTNENMGPALIFLILGFVFLTKKKFDQCQNGLLLGLLELL